MSLSAKTATKTRVAILDRCIKLESQREIREYLEGYSELRYWDLTQDEADDFAEKREYYRNFDHSVFVTWLRSNLRKSAGAAYMAARIVSGAEADLRQLTQDWFIHRNIKRELSKDELSEIGVTPMDLRMIGIEHKWETRAFYKLYKEVRVPDRVFHSSCQVNVCKVKAMALTANYNRLPLWVKKILLESNQWIESDENARIGNIWRLIDCAKAWKWCPSLPKGIAEQVGRMSPRSRIFASIAWKNIDCLSFWECSEKEWKHYVPNKDGNYDRVVFSRSKWVNLFWIEFRRISKLSIFQLIEESSESLEHGKLRILVEQCLALPHQFLLEDWGRRKDFSKDKAVEILATYGSPSEACQHLFGCKGLATAKAFQSCKNKNAWKWASAIADRNPDAVQKILQLRDVIAYETDAIDFMKSLPMSSRLRLLGSTTFKYCGQVQPVSNDHIRDTGYLWKNIQQKPVLGRIRCWFSVHEILAAAYVKELPDEALPIPTGWETVDGLCSVDGLWSLEFPKRVATLKYYGQVLRNCVGGYGKAIKQGRSVIFVVRESGVLTHCVEVSNGDIQQFYQAGNSSSDSNIERSVCVALRQAKLLFY